MKSIVLSVLMCLAMSLSIQAKAAAGQIDQAIDQKVTQVVKDKVWKLKADMVFLSGGKTEALPSDSCFMEVNGAEAAVCLPYLGGEQDGEAVGLLGQALDQQRETVEPLPVVLVGEDGLTAGGAAEHGGVFQTHMFHLRVTSSVWIWQPMTAAAEICPGAVDKLGGNGHSIP